MRIQEYDRVRTLVEVTSGLGGRTWPAGTEGTVVDITREGEYYAVDVGDSEVGWDNLILAREQFEVLSL